MSSSEDQFRVETAMDVLLVLLYAGSKKIRETIAGITKLEKLVYLLKKETSLSKLVDENFTYEPYHFGPYSAEVLDNIEALEELGLVKAISVPSESYVEESDRYQVGAQVKESDTDSNAPQQIGNMDVFELTDDGVKVAQTLFKSMDHQQQQEITQLKDRFNSLDLRQLLRYVYTKYPESTTESKIKDYVLA
jgi:uncharacterized protein YwgA